jgi:hypothetical protein
MIISTDTYREPGPQLVPGPAQIQIDEMVGWLKDRIGDMPGHQLTMILIHQYNSAGKTNADAVACLACELSEMIITTRNQLAVILRAYGIRFENIKPNSTGQ